MMAGLSRAYKRRPKSFPLSIAGLQLWLDASDASTLFTDSAGTIAATADGDPVGHWKDKSGNNINVIQSDGLKKPALKSSIKNGKNIVRWSSTYGLHLIGSSFPALTTQTAVAVLSWYYAPYSTVLLHSNAGTMNYAPCGNDNFENSLSARPRVADNIVSVNTFSWTNNTWGVWKTRHTGSQIKTEKNALTEKTYTHTLSSNVGGLRIGTTRTDQYEQLQGDVAEVIFYNNSISDSDLSALNNYLNVKWGVY